MIEKLQVETWDGKSKILAELNVIKKLAENKIIVNVYGNIFKELTYDQGLKVWKVTKEDIDGNTINNGQTKRGSSSADRTVKKRTKSIH